MSGLNILIDKLRRANSELFALYDVNRLLLSPLSAEDKLYIILTTLTADDGFGYRRAYLLLTDEKTNTLSGWLGVGPLSGEQAREIWSGVAAVDEDTEKGDADLHELLERAPFDYSIRSFMYPITRGAGHPIQTVISKRPRLIKDVFSRKDPINEMFLEYLSMPQALFIPLVAENRALGVMVVEASDEENTIDEARIRILGIFANLAATALQASMLHRSLNEKIDGLKAANEELSQAHARILQLDRLSSMGAIASGVAHEIKNPLNSINIMMELLKYEVDENVEANRLIGVIEDEVGRINETVTEFLTFVSTPKLDMCLIDMHYCLDHVIALIEHQGERSGVSIVREYSEQVGKIMGDERKIKEAFLNVALNALQAMPSGGELCIRTEPLGDGGGAEMYKVEFTDSGEGIPEQVVEKLFEPFFTTKESGSGMGLPIVDSIMRLHGGSINLTSSPGKGTRVVLGIPKPRISGTSGAD